MVRLCRSSRKQSRFGGRSVWQPADLTDTLLDEQPEDNRQRVPMVPNLAG
jgi:hypothetical protein